MAKRKTKPDTRGPLQRVYDRETVANEQSNISVITPEMRAKGTYAGERRIVNNHSPVMRWIASGKLTEGQERAILYMTTRWRRISPGEALTANYGGVSGGSGDLDARAAMEIEAREDIQRAQSHFANGLESYYRVFENVCRWGQPAGVAGELLSAGSSRSAEVRAHQVVCFVADILVMKERL